MPEKSATASAVPAAEDDAIQATAVPAMTTVELSLVVLAVAAVVLCLQWGKGFFVPVLLGILISYSLRIPVTYLENFRIPRMVGAACVLGLVTAFMATAVYSLRDDALVVVDQLPGAALTVRNMLHDGEIRKPGVLSSIGRAAAELERAATEAAGGGATPKAQPAPATAPGFIRQYLLIQTSSALIALLQLAAALAIAYFLLAAGDTFRRKLVRRAGTSLAQRRATVEMLNEIDTHIQRYMLATVIVNLLVGILSCGFFYAMGVDRPMVLGVLAGTLHLFPYVGTAAAGTVVAAVGLLQFNDVKFALLLAGGTMFIAGITTFLFNNWLHSNSFKMNSTVVIVGVLFFGWLWGAWGIFLAVPLLAVIKTICERVPPWSDVADFLAE